MGQPVKLSDSLVEDARLTSALTERSIAAQIEHWASLGKAIEPILGYEQLLGLKRRGAARSLVDSLTEVETEAGRNRLRDVLAMRPFPHYEPVPGAPGELVRVDAEAKRVRGRFVKRQFVPVR